MSDEHTPLRVQQLHDVAEQLQCELGSRCGWINLLSTGSESLVVELAAPRLVGGAARSVPYTAEALEQRVQRIVTEAMPDAVVSIFLHGATS